MTGWHACTAFQRDCLTAIAACTQANDLPYGLALKDYLDDQYPEPVNHSRLYQNLDQLVEAGLVIKRSHDARTNAYALTAVGRNALLAQANRLARLADQRPVTGGDQR